MLKTLGFSLACAIFVSALVLHSAPLVAGPKEWEKEKEERWKLNRRINLLVEEFKKADPKRRDAIVGELRKIGDPTVQAVRSLMNDARFDDDARQRAKVLHAHLMDARERERAANEKRLRVRFRKELALGIDYYVGRMVRDRKKLNDDDWEILNQLEERLKKEGRANGAQKNSLERIWYKGHDKLNAFNDKRAILSDSCIAADSIHAGVIGNSLIVCKSNFEISSSSFTESIGLLAKDIQLKNGVAVHSVIMSEGDLVCNWLFSDAVVVAGGNVKIALGTRVLVIARGTVTIDSPVQCTVREKATRVFDEVGFFAPERVGLEVQVLDQGMIVQKVQKDSAFAKAGLQAADRIVAMGDTKVASQNQFTDLLRAAVLAKEATLGIRRQETEMKIRVQFD